MQSFIFVLLTWQLSELLNAFELFVYRVSIMIKVCLKGLLIVVICFLASKVDGQNKLKKPIEENLKTAETSNSESVTQKLSNNSTSGKPLRYAESSIYQITQQTSAQSGLAIFHNPSVNDGFTIKALNTDVINAVELYNILGIKIDIVADIQGNTAYIDLKDSITNGIYFCKVRINQEYRTIRIAKATKR